MANVSNQFEGNWTELKGKIRKAWGKLTDDEIEETKGRWEELKGRLQKKYGYTVERAQDEIDKFRSNLH